MSQESPRPRRQLFMRRPHFHGLPDLALPAELRVRIAGLEDVSALAGLLSAAFRERWDVDRVRRDLLEDLSVAATYVIERADGRLVATASSRLLPARYPGTGYLHWVGADPTEGGRGLGFWITVVVLRDFAGRGLTDSVLETDDDRLPAIATYLKCGYLPEPRDPPDEARWRAVAAALRPGTLTWPVTSDE